MFKTRFTFSLLIIGACIASCAKHDMVSDSAIVYVAGYDNDGAKYWRNELMTNLPGTRAKSIVVEVNDVYVVGFANNVNNIVNSVAKYWKNGVSTDLTDGTNNAMANAITISNGDVYVAGLEYGVNGNGVQRSYAKYWKNGAPVTLSDGSANAVANGIVVTSAGIYVVGTDGPSAAYWLNRVQTNLTTLSSPTSQDFSVGNAIAVSGNDVYVAGYQLSGSLQDVAIAKYWKNGIETILSDGTQFSTAQAITLDGQDVLVVGGEMKTLSNPINRALYWKNGVATYLSDAGIDAFAYSIAVLGSDVYISGNLTEDGGAKLYGVYWKNGVARNLVTHGEGYGLSIYLVK